MQQTTQERQTTHTSSEESADTSEGVVEWQCPFCPETWDTPGEVRDHITMSTEGEHMGVSGWSISNDIVGYNANGEPARVIEGFSQTTDPEDTKERGYKKRQIVNAYLADFEKADVDAVTAVTDASRPYVHRVLGEIHEDEFNDAEVAEMQSEELITELREDLNEFHNQTDSTEKNMEAEAVDVTDDGELADEDKIAVPRGEGRSYLYNLMMAVPDISPSSVPKVLDLSAEYARRTFKQVREGDVSKSDVEAEFDESRQRNLIDAFEITGELDGYKASISETLDIEQEEPADESSSGSADSEEEGEEEWPEFDERSKVLIINLYELMEEHGEELSPTTLSNAAHCGYEYARRTLRELEDGDVPEHEIEAESDSALQNSLLEAARENGYFVEESTEDTERTEEESADEHEAADAEYAAAVSGGVVEAITDFERGADGRATQCVGLTGDDSRCAFDPVEDSHFCGIHKPDESELGDTDADTTTESEEVDEEELPDIPGSGRDALLTLWTFDVDLTNEQSGKAADVSGEYARRTLNDVRDGEITQSEIDSAATSKRKQVVQQRLEMLGYLESDSSTVSWTSEPVEESESEPETEQESEPAAEESEQAELDETVEEPEEAVDAVMESVDGMVPAAEVQRIKTIVDVLLEQAKYEDEGQNKKAEFIANKVSEELEGVLAN